jgi:copper homeostasis protein
MIEACVSSAAEAVAAEQAGAGRLELCAALELGGLTPSLGLLETVRAAVALPIVVMLRPRGGGFRYDRHEFASMCRDAERLLAAGANGIVFGLFENSPGGATGKPRIDVQRVAQLVKLAGSQQTVFHRAFDFLPDPAAGLEQLIERDVRRVLTSGGATSAWQGRETLAALHGQANGRIEILPAGGIRADHVAELSRVTGCADAHIGGSQVVTDGSLDHLPELNLVDQRCTTRHRFRRLDAEALAEAVRTSRHRPAARR